MFLLVLLQGQPGPEGSPGAKGYPGRQVQYMASGSSVAVVVWRWPRVPPRQREAAGWGPRSCAHRVGPEGSAIQGVGRRNPLFEGMWVQDAEKGSWGWGGGALEAPPTQLPTPPSTPPGTLGQSGVLSVKTAGLVPLPFYRRRS